MFNCWCNRFIQNSWSGDLHTHTRPLYDNWANEDSSEKITACQKFSGFLIISLAHLYLLAMLAGWRSGLIGTQVFQGIFWLMTHSIASPVTDQWLRFEVPSPLIFEGFWGILLMAQDDQNSFYSLLGFVLELGDDTVHSGQWNGQIPGYLSLTCTSLYLTNNSPRLKIWVPKNPVTEACWFTVVHYSQYIAHFNH